jgi:hypothetical protein
MHHYKSSQHPEKSPVCGMYQSKVRDRAMEVDPLDEWVSTTEGQQGLSENGPISLNNHFHGYITRMSWTSVHACQIRTMLGATP